MSEFLDGRIVLYCGDCRAVLATLGANSIDACVTDPPYHLTTGKNGGSGVASLNENSPAGRSRIGTGFMGKQWDGGDVAFRVETWQAVYRVMKPGAHLLAFGGTRTYHRMACAIEDAGFEIRDCIMWLYGSGFPKSHDVSKGIDRAAGAERKIVGRYNGATNVSNAGSGLRHDCYGIGGDKKEDTTVYVTAPATDAARQWEGWGTSLKPACEPIVLARKPLSEGTVAANVLKWGTGAINVDGCRVEGEPVGDGHHNVSLGSASGGIYGTAGAFVSSGHAMGRWPANVIHDGSEEVVAGFPAETSNGNWSGRQNGAAIWGGGQDGYRGEERASDSGSAARFFYTAKADSDDRLGSKHPTVKPVDLMQYLVRLVTPPGGSVLDPFAGTGTTAEAAWREGMRAVLIEAEPEYQADIRRRMELAKSGPGERAAKIAANSKQAIDPGPLFGGAW